MAAPRRPRVELDDAFLRRVLARARRDGNLALAADAERHHAALRVAPLPSLRYVALATASDDGRHGNGRHGDGGPRAIPGAMFQRRYALCIDSLELTLHGYCIQRRSGWERRVEQTFSTSAPPPWRRALRPAPLLAFTVRAGADATTVHLAVAPPSAACSAPMVVRLEPALQLALAQLHAGAARRPSLAARVLGWLLRRPRH